MHLIKISNKYVFEELHCLMILIYRIQSLAFAYEVSTLCYTTEVNLMVLLKRDQIIEKEKSNFYSCKN